MNRIRLIRATNLKSTILLLISVVFLSLIANYKFKSIKIPKLKISMQDSRIVFDHKPVLIFNSGFKRILASLTWIKTLLDADIIHFNDPRGYSWIYHRVNFITEIDPSFKEVFQVGSVYLSIIKDDIKGASLIYDKGLKLFPDDFQLNFHGGFHSMSEEKNHEKAVTRYLKIINHPRSPKFLPSLVSKLKAKSGDLDDAITFIKHNIQTAPSEFLKKQFIRTYKLLLIEKDLKCLNVDGNIDSCKLTGPDGVKYIKVDGKYKAEKIPKKIK